MILGASEFPQMLQRETKGVDSALAPFLENLVNSTTSFRDTLMSSAHASNFSLSEDFEGLSKIKLSLSERAEHFADRFDMTGVLGHTYITSNTNMTHANQSSRMLDLTHLSSDKDIGQKLETHLDVSLQDDLKVEQKLKRVEEATETKKITPKKKVQGKTPLRSLGEVSSKTPKNTMDMSQFLDADGILLSSNFSADIGDGANEVSRSSLKTPIQSLLNTTSSHAHSNQLLVALQSLENGLRLYTRVQNMSLQEQAELLVNARALLIENGFFDAEIVIEEFSHHANQNKDGGE